MQPLERSFRAMNTGMRILLYARRGSVDRCRRALLAAEADVRAQEARFSRFLPASELSRLNQSGGQWVKPSPEMLEALTLAVGLGRESCGLFNPGVLPALEWAGYDQSFDRLPAERPSRPTPLLAGGGIEGILFDGEWLRLPAGCRLDLGGIVKGWTADRIAAALSALGPTLVDLGGDIAVRGKPPEGAWCIGVETPERPGRLLAACELEAGGVATSGVVRRKWRLGAVDMHHIIDPRSGRPADSDVVQAVARAESAARADVWAKTALILGTAGCEALLRRIAGLELLLVTADGKVVATSGLPLSHAAAA